MEKIWTQITIVLSLKLIKLYINGALETSFNAELGSAKCINSKFSDIETSKNIF